MSSSSIAIVILLAIGALFCVIGVVGMWRMREPTQALHYMNLPATVGIACVTVAVLLQTGFSSALIKSSVIALILLSINSVVTHATARAFYIRNQNRGRSNRPPWDFSREEQQ